MLLLEQWMFLRDDHMSEIPHKEEKVDKNEDAGHRVCWKIREAVKNVLADFVR